MKEYFSALLIEKFNPIRAFHRMNYWERIKDKGYREEIYKLCDMEFRRKKNENR